MSEDRLITRTVEEASLPRRSLRPYFIILAMTALLIVSVGCGNTTTIPSDHTHDEHETYIRGEVIEVTREVQDGDLGTVLIEGTRSSPVDEALLTVTKNSRIIDRRSGKDQAASLDTVNERQTVEADFKVVSSSPQTWRAEVEELVICP